MGEERLPLWERLRRRTRESTRDGEERAGIYEGSVDSRPESRARSARMRSVRVPSRMVISVHGRTPDGPRSPSWSIDVDQMKVGDRRWIALSDIAVTAEGGVLVCAGATVWRNPGAGTIAVHEDGSTQARVTMGTDGSVRLEIPDSFRPETHADSWTPYVTVSRLSTRSGEVLGAVEGPDEPGTRRTSAMPRALE